MSDNIIAAIRFHVKALRLLGRDGTSILAIAHALRLEQKEVTEAISNYRVPMAFIDDRKSVSFTRTKTEFSPYIGFRKAKRAARQAPRQSK